MREDLPQKVSVVELAPGFEALMKTDPFLERHPGEFAWEEDWVVGIAVARLRTEPTAPVHRCPKPDCSRRKETPRPAVEIFVVKRKAEGHHYNSSRHGPRQGPSERHLGNHWAIPTTYVQPNHVNTSSALLGKLWEDLGMRVKHIVGNRGCSSWTRTFNQGGGRKVRQITYIVTANGICVNPKHYSEYGWIQLEKLDSFEPGSGQGFMMTPAARKEIIGVFSCLEVR
jgi:hypothetical protein